MVQIVKVVYNKGEREGYAIKTRKGYIPVTISSNTFAEFKDIVSEKNVEIDVLGNIVFVQRR